MKAKKVLAFICLIALCTAFLTACENETKVNVATVDGTSVSSGAFAFYLDIIKQTIASDPLLNIVDEESWNIVEIDNQKAINFAKEKALDEIVKDTIQVEKAKAAGITLNEDDKVSIQTQKNNLAIRYGSTDALKSQLKLLGISDDEFNTIFENFMYVAKFREKMIFESDDLSYVSDVEIQEEYDRFAETYIQNTVNVKHILIMFASDDGIERTEEEALEEAKALYTRAQGGEEFEALVLEYSEDTADVNAEGIGYQFNYDNHNMDMAFAQAGYELGVGEISEPVRTTYGYHVIKRYTPEVELPAIEDLRDTIIQNLQYARYFDLVEQWKSEAVIVKNEEAISAI